MKALLRLYPRSWLKRYGPEMEVLLEDLPGEVGVGVDLVVGAAAAYIALVRGNRILSAAGSFLHGICVAVLLQAIAFVLFVLLARSSPGGKWLAIGTIPIARLWYTGLLGLGGGIRTLPSLVPSLQSVAELIVLLLLIASLAFVLAAPRMATRLATSAPRPGSARRRADARQPRRGRPGSPSRRGA